MFRIFFPVLIFMLSACQTATLTPQQSARILTNRAGYFTVQQLQKIRKTYAKPCKQAGFQPNTDGHDLCMAAMHYGKQRK